MSHSAQYCPKQEEMYLVSPGGSDTALVPQLEEEDSSCPITSQPVGDCHNWANKKSLYLELTVSFNGLFVHNSSSQVKKRFFLSFSFSGLPCGLLLDVTSRITVLCCSQTNPFFFFWRNIWLSILFMVNYIIQNFNVTIFLLSTKLMHSCHTAKCL